MKNKFYKEINKTIKQMEEYYNIDLSDLKFDFNLDNITSLGVYRPLTNTISLNIHLLEEYGELYINEVGKHELAHAVVRELYGIVNRPHGIEFKRVCQVLRIPGKATTDLFSESKYIQQKRNKRKRKEYVYTCECKKHNISGIRHNKILKGINYICNTCKSKLKFTGEIV